jgi:hypothetical protein
LFPEISERCDIPELIEISRKSIPQKADLFILIISNGWHKWRAAAYAA